MQPITNPNIARFHFASFTWPRYVAALTPIAKLRVKRESRKRTGPYYHAPKPNDSRCHGFYLGEAGQPFSRWQWADSVADAGIKHKGWYIDDYGCLDVIRGIVALLPHGRYLAGHSMGESMASVVYPGVLDDLVEAARMADEHAQVAAELEREYNETDGGLTP